MKFGVHVGIGGGFRRSIDEALASESECIQIFAGNPRGWRTTPYNAPAWAEFARLRAAHHIAPTVIHTSYLINLASADAALRAKSIGLIKNDLSVAAKGKIEFVNTNLGSYGDQPRDRGFARVCALLDKLVRDTPAGPMLLLENSAGGGNRCGGTIEEIGRFVREVGSRRIGACLDTAHLWANGYELATAAGVAHVLEEIRKHVGFKRVHVLHLNDTQVALGARNDVHWHLGEGRIGSAGLRALLACRDLAHVACICETPKSPELDLRNVRIARRLAGVRRSGVGPKPKSTSGKHRAGRNF